MKAIHSVLVASLVLGLAADAAGAPCIDVRTDVANPATPDIAGDDDRIGIQQAIEKAFDQGGGAICLHRGVYEIKSKAPNSSTASFHLGAPRPPQTGPAVNIAFIGDGPGTVLKLANTSITGPWYMFQLNNGANHIEFRELTLDGAGASNAIVTHLVQVGTGDANGTSDITLDRVTVRSSRTDAIEIGGSNADLKVASIAIRSSLISGNVAKGVVIRQGVRGVQIVGNRFDGNGDSDFVVTYSSGVTLATPTQGISFVNNLVTRSLTAPPLAVSIVGFDANGSSYKDLDVSGNVFLSGRIALRGFDRVTMAHNIVIGGSQASAIPELSVTGGGDSIAIDGNMLIRTSTTAANVVSFSHVGALIPKRCTVTNNVMLQPTASSIAVLVSATAVTFAGNYLGFRSSSTNTFAGIGLRAFANPMTDLHVTDNVIAGNEPGGLGGTLATAVQLTPDAFSIGRVIITGNVVRNATSGVKLDTGTYTTIPFVANNLFATTTDVTGTASPIAIAGNLGAPVRLVGTGAPTAVVPDGSIYTSRGGGSHTTLYVRQAGVWVGK